MIWERILDFIYPKVCVGCGLWGCFLCSECQERLDFVDQICPMCGEESLMGWTHTRCQDKYGLDGLIAIYEYREPVARAVIDGVKYGFNKELLKIVLKGFEFETGENFDCLVPVPLHFYRENWRGFNQAELLGTVLSSQIRLPDGQVSVPVERILKRVRNTKQQVTMKTREDREANIRGAFEISEKFKNSKLKKLKILLVDDVFTSGAGMRECTKILKKAGVEKVWGLALAH